MTASPDPLLATIKIPLQSMLQPEDLDKLMDYAQRERITPDTAVLRALVAILPQMTPPSPPAPAAQAA